MFIYAAKDASDSNFDLGAVFDHQQREFFNNVYVKNIPLTWSAYELYKRFEVGLASRSLTGYSRTFTAEGFTKTLPLL